MSGKFSSFGLFPDLLPDFFFWVLYHSKQHNFACSVSKQQAIVPGQCYELEDGSSSFKDFHGSRNNRFASPEQAAKNRIQHPSNVLHFFNAQPDVTPELFSQVRTSKWTCWIYLILHKDIVMFTCTKSTFYSGSSAHSFLFFCLTDLWRDWCQGSGQRQNVYRQGYASPTWS